MSSLNSAELRAQSRYYRNLADRLAELADLLESGAPYSCKSEAAGEPDTLPKDDFDISTEPGRRTKVDVWREVLMAVATEPLPVTQMEIVKKVRNLVKEQTVYAIFRRDREKEDTPGEPRDFKQQGKDKGAQYELSDRYAWVFVYGISMDRTKLEEEFSGELKFDELVIGCQKAFLQNAKLSFRNYSKKWQGGTATFDVVDEEQLCGVAYLVRNPEGLAAFEKRERPAYELLKEPQEVLLSARRIPVKAWVFNVAAERKQEKNCRPSREYIRIMESGAKKHGHDPAYIHNLLKLMDTEVGQS